MKKTFLLGFILILSITLFVRYANTGVSIKTYETDFKFTVKDIVNALESPGLHLIPQWDDGSYDGDNLNNVKPRRYEIVDATLLVYEFDSNEAFINDLDKVQTIFSEKTNYKLYVLNNVLVIYLWLSESTPTDLADERIAKIEKGIQELVNSITK